MIISNVNIGSYPGANDGESIYSAFYKVNQNFANVQSNVNSLTNSVSSVAGRTGNVTLTIADVVGLATTYASQANIITANVGMKGYVDAKIAANVAALVDSSPAVLDTLNELAAALNDDASFSTTIVNTITLANTIQSQQITAANVGIIGYIDQANTIQSAQVGAANLAITAANLGMKGYVDSVASQSIYGNVNVQAYTETMGFQNYGNVNVAAYVTTANSAIVGYIDQANTIQSAQVGAANLAITAANLGMKGYVDNQITTIVGGAPAILDTLGELANALGADANLSVTITSQIANVNANITTANLGMVGYVDNKVSTANIGIIGYIDLANTIQSAQVNAANLAITAANLGMKGYVDSVANQSIYGNGNVASYLISTQVSVANILLAPSGNIVFADGTVQTTASGGNYGNIDVKAYLATEPGDAQRLIQGYYANLDLGATAELYSFGVTSKSYFGHDGYQGDPGISTVIADNYFIKISTYNGAYNWTFDNTGNLTLPGNVAAINYANGVSILSGLGSGGDNYSNVNVKAYTETMGFQNFGNVNVAAVITTNGLTNYSNVNVKAYTESMGFQNFSNVNVAAYVTTANSAVIGYVDNAVSTANVGIIGYIDRGNTIVTAGITTANVGMKGYVDNLSLDNLSDVVISSPTVGDVLYYNGTNWEKQNGPTIRWSLSNSGTNDYVFTGPGFYASTNDPLLYLHRGTTYIFVNTVHGSHPLEIRVSNGGAAYANGVSGAGTATITFTVPMDAPSTLYYQCTVHSIMGNTINVVT